MDAGLVVCTEDFAELKDDCFFSLIHGIGRRQKDRADNDEKNNDR